MPKVGEQFTINDGRTLIAVEWRGEFFTRRGVHYWMFEAEDGRVFMKNKADFKTEGKSWKAAPGGAH